MKTLEGSNSKRNRDNEEALLQQLIQNREQLLDNLLSELGYEDILESKFESLLDQVVSFENVQFKYIQAYQHEKTMNDHFFNGMYGDDK